MTYLENDHDRCAHPPVGGVQDSSVLADLILDLECDARTKARTMRRASGIRADTHWSRILSVDLDEGSDGGSGASSRPDGTRARGDRRDRLGQRWVTGAVILFAVCALLYLAVTGGLHAMTIPDGIDHRAPEDIGGPASPDAPVSLNRFAMENDHARIDPIP